MIPTVAATISTPLTAVITPIMMTKTERKRQTTLGSNAVTSKYSSFADASMSILMRMNYYL